MLAKKLILLIILLIILNCGTIPDIHYYLIDYPVEIIKDTEIKHDHIIGIESFRTDPLYEENRLVYRDSPYEAKFYNYHQWITPPKEIVTDKVLTQFSASNLFNQVVKFPRYNDVNKEYEAQLENEITEYINDHILIACFQVDDKNTRLRLEDGIISSLNSDVNFIVRGTIKAFEEWDDDFQWFANVKIYFELVNRKNNKVVWHGTKTSKQKVDDKKPIEVVKALGDCLQICINKAIHDIDEILLSY